MVLDHLDDTIGEKRNLVSTSQESTTDFVRVDISIVVMFLKHGLLCQSYINAVFTGNIILCLRSPLK